MNDWKKVNKNDYGYIEARIKKLILINVVALGLPLAIFGTGMLVYKSNANMLTLVAVLGMLPAAQQIVGLVMILKARKHQCSEELHNELVEIAGNDSFLHYDFYITSYDVQYPVQALIVADDSIIGYSVSGDFKHDKFNEHVKNILSQNSLSVSVIKVFEKKDKDKFLSRVKALAEKEYVQTDKDLSVIKIMESISL